MIKLQTTKYVRNTISTGVMLLLILLLAFPYSSHSASNQIFSPYIEKFSNGWIDWDNGLIYGTGKGYLHKNNNIKSRAKGAASLIASGNILKLAAGINLDDQKVLNSLGKKEITIQLKAFIKAKEYSLTFVNNPSQPYYEVVKVASIKGLQGLTAKLLGHLNSTPWRKLPIRTKTDSLNDDGEPWLIIDARDLSANNTVDPALFPEIVSSSGEIVYSLENVHENALVQRGMARYVVTDTPFYRFQSSSALPKSLLEQISSLFTVREAEAKENRKRTRRKTYIVKKAEGVQGLAKTNLIISQEDANKLKSEDMSSQILKKCRVIIVVSSPVGGIEGMLKDYPRHLTQFPRL